MRERPCRSAIEATEQPELGRIERAIDVALTTGDVVGRDGLLSPGELARRDPDAPAGRMAPTRAAADATGAAKIPRWCPLGSPGSR